MKGLHNLGQTCYLNSIIQILFNTPSFPEMFTLYYKHSNMNENDDGLKGLTHKFIKLMHSYLDENNSDTPQHLVNFVKHFKQCYNGYSYSPQHDQHDQHENLLFLFRAIHDHVNIETRFNITGTKTTIYDKLEYDALQEWRLNGMSTTNILLKKDDNNIFDSPIRKLFTGQYCFQTECRNPNCKYISNVFETFKGCEIPITFKGDHSLHDVLKAFTGITQLDKDNKHECDKCKKRGRSLKKNTFWRLPDILIFQLKRNDFHRVNRCIINPPDILDMEPYTSAPRDSYTYELYATGNHLGTPESGHYYSQIKKNGQWYVVNDHIIKQGKSNNPEHICLLFYSKLKTTQT